MSDAKQGSESREWVAELERRSERLFVCCFSNCSGEPPSVEPSATLLVHEQRVPLSHTNDDASRKPNVPDDYVSTEESLSYKERIKEGTSRQP